MPIRKKESQPKRLFGREEERQFLELPSQDRTFYPTEFILSGVDLHQFLLTPTLSFCSKK